LINEKKSGGEKGAFYSEGREEKKVSNEMFAKPWGEARKLSVNSEEIEAYHYRRGEKRRNDLLSQQEKKESCFEKKPKDSSQSFKSGRRGIKKSHK